MDSACGAGIRASAAGDAIAGDLKCHDKTSLVVLILSLLNYNISFSVCNCFSFMSGHFTRNAAKFFENKSNKEHSRANFGLRRSIGQGKSKIRLAF